MLLPLRLSFIVPCNLVLDTLMMSAQGRLQVAGAQWLNQTYNALHYRANRNATHEESTSVLAAAYLGATASSVTAALAVERWASRAPASSRWAPVLRRLGPLAAVAAADVLNVSLMRQSEFIQGVAVRKNDGEVVGHSRVAGAAGVAACIFGRVAAAAPVLSLPPLLLYGLEARSPWLRARPAAATAALMVGVGVCIQVAVPLTFGIFKQTASLPSAWLEADIAAAAPGQELYFNKGL